MIFVNIFKINQKFYSNFFEILLKVCFENDCEDRVKDLVSRPMKQIFIKDK